MRILITGGAGFIGSHLAERLLSGGHEATVLDNLSTGSLENLAHLRRSRKLHVAVDSIFHERVLAKLVDRNDAVAHLAAAVGVKLVVEHPVRTIETNIHGTEIVLRHAARRKRPVLFTSSSEVYGKSAQAPFSEDDDCVLGAPTAGRWAYATSKLIDECLALSYWREQRLPVVIVRLFNTSGPRQSGRYGMVLPRFIEQALRGGPLTVYGSGRQTRSFAHVDDVAGALVRLLEEKRAWGRIFNLGNDEEITINALAREVRRRVNPRAAVRHIPYAVAYGDGFEDMRRRVPDLARIRRLIGYRPRHNVEDIIDSILEHLKPKRRSQEPEARREFRIQNNSARTPYSGS
ncbi:MAG: NAD-dependent epimerase/dehydratase family protein [Planctomycetes bacterium]|nr:NAD-dependent epimerase/dehydratase family protein [Planctomycetota bacterium]